MAPRAKEDDQVVEDTDVVIDIDSNKGVLDFTSYALNQPRAAAKRVEDARALLGGGKLLEAQELEDGNLKARCRGSAGEVYEVAVEFQSHESPRDWAELKCSCPSREKEKVCKHSLALMLWRVQQRTGAGAANQAAAAVGDPSKPSQGPNTAQASTATGHPAAGADNTGPAAAAAAVQPARVRKLPAFMVRRPAIQTEGGGPVNGAATAKAATPKQPAKAQQQPSKATINRTKATKAPNTKPGTVLQPAKKPKPTQAAARASSAGGDLVPLAGQQMLDASDEDLLADCTRILAAQHGSAAAMGGTAPALSQQAEEHHPLQEEAGAAAVGGAPARGSSLGRSSSLQGGQMLDGAPNRAGGELRPGHGPGEAGIHAAAGGGKAKKAPAGSGATSQLTEEGPGQHALQQAHFVQPVPPLPQQSAAPAAPQPDSLSLFDMMFGAAPAATVLLQAAGTLVPPPTAVPSFAAAQPAVPRAAPQQAAAGESTAAPPVAIDSFSLLDLMGRPTASLALPAFASQPQPAHPTDSSLRQHLEEGVDAIASGPQGGAAGLPTIADFATGPLESSEAQADAIGADSQAGMSLAGGRPRQTSEAEASSGVSSQQGGGILQELGIPTTQQTGGQPFGKLSLRQKMAAKRARGA